MSVPLEVLAAQVLSLPSQERAELLDRLVASIETSSIDPEWERAWSAEIDRREQDIASGRASWVSGDELVTRLRARLLGTNPGLGTPTMGNRRIFALRSFPYSIVYRAEQGGIRIGAVAHHRRRPGYWKSRV